MGTAPLAYFNHKFKITDNEIKTIIDTGAEISLIKFGILSEDAKKRISHSSVSTITGISHVGISPVGVIQTQLFSMPITFHVINDDDITITADALIGMAVLKWSTIDFPNNELKFKHSGPKSIENKIKISFDNINVPIKVEKNVGNDDLCNEFKNIAKNAKKMFKENKKMQSIFKNIFDQFYDHVEHMFMDQDETQNIIDEVKEIWNEYDSQSQSNPNNDKFPTADSDIEDFYDNYDNNDNEEDEDDKNEIPLTANNVTEDNESSEIESEEEFGSDCEEEYSNYSDTETSSSEIYEKDQDDEDYLENYLENRRILKLKPQTKNFVSFPCKMKGQVMTSKKQLKPGVLVGNCLTKSNGQYAKIPIINLNPKVAKIETNKHQNLFEQYIEEGTQSPPENDIRDRNRDQFILNELKKYEEWSNKEFDSISSICLEYSDVFHLPNDTLSFCTGVEHGIVLKEGTPPISLRNHRLPPSHNQIINKTVQNLLDQNIIQHSTSPWNAPLLVVPKKSTIEGEKSWRVVVDYRKLNASTRQDAYPLPRIEDILDQLGESHFYSTMDLESGYYQVLLKSEDREKTAFSTPYGHYEFTKMPFGLTNGPATFQRMMNLALTGLNGIECLVYLDDIVVHGRTFEEHNKRLEHVLERLRANNLKVKISKCQFLRDEILFLGHKITKNGILPDPGKIQAVLEFPPPTSVKKLQSFLGLANYYRKFIEGFANIAEPLNKLLRNNEKYVWNESCQSSFEKLKEALTTPPVLIFPDYSKEFIVTTDASNFALGAVLSQGVPGHDRPISYASKSLDNVERKYATIEREMLAIVYAIKQFRCYLINRKFVVYTDHKPLTGALRSHDTTSRLTNLLNKIIDYDYVIKYKPGKINCNADALSRLPYEDLPNKILITTRSKAKEQKQEAKLDKTQEILEVQEPELDQSCHDITTNDINVKQQRYKDAKLITDDEEKERILREFHDNVLGGHQGRDKTFDKIRRQFFWKGLYSDVDNFVKKCEDCQRSKNGRNIKMPMFITDTPYKPFEKVYLDVVGPLNVTLSGNKYILTFEDDLTKFMDCVAVPDQETRTIAEAFVERIICRFSLPNRLITDRGTNFESKIFRETCKLLKIKKESTTSYHPQSNGSLERSHRPLADYLRIFERKYPDTWDLYLAPAMFVRNTAVHSSTKFTPTELLFGFNPKIPNSIKTKTEPLYNYEDYSKILKFKLQEAYGVARENLISGKHKSKEHYDRTSREECFEVGDWVRIKNPAKKGKLDFNWSEPYKITKINSDNNVTLKMGKKSVRIHNNRLKLSNSK